MLEQLPEASVAFSFCHFGMLPNHSGMISLAGNTPHTLDEVRRVFCIEDRLFQELSDRAAQHPAGIYLQVNILPVQ